jgi:DME family drug/metabolite transporter
MPSRSSARLQLIAAAVLVGAAYATCLTLFVLANRLTTAASAIFLQSAAPL